MNTWKVILATMVIFGTGVITGGLLVRSSQRPPFLAGGRPNPNLNLQRQSQPNSAGGVRVEFLRRAERELNLTAEQRERIDKILAVSQDRTRKIMEPVSPRMREEVQRTKDEFREVLTADQRRQFDDLVKQQQRPRDQRHPGAPREHNSDNFAAPVRPDPSLRNP